MKNLHHSGKLRAPIIALLIILSFSPAISAQPAYISNSGTITFHSHAPIEDITATTSQVNSTINPSEGVITVKVPVSSFAFKKQLMKKHFNEQYMITEEYPFSEFRGKLQGDFENVLSLAREAKLRVTGDLTIKGITKPVSEIVSLVRKGNELEGSVSFKVKLADYEIKIPRMLIKNIAEEIEVSVKIIYQLKDQ
jgi:polyisoprenoid-binding protein YceI